MKQLLENDLENDLEKVLCNHWPIVSPTATTYIVINNFEEEETNLVTTQPVESKITVEVFITINSGMFVWHIWTSSIICTYFNSS